MTANITIIGLGQIGSSIGLALKDRPDLLYRVGHDLDIKTAQQAEKIGAVDRVVNNLPESVKEADLVLLAIPIDQIYETLQVIGSILRPGAVVMDTAPVKSIILEWINQLLPDTCFYVGLTPVLNPGYLMTSSSGIDAARPDLFQSGLIAIVASSNSNADAVKLASDLTQMVGAAPFFIDRDEIDGLMAATHFLPQLMMAALINATVDEPGWREARKVAGRPFAQVTHPMDFLENPSALAQGLNSNRINTVRVLDNLMASIHEIRQIIDQNDEVHLLQLLAQAKNKQHNWWQERQAGDWLSTEGLPAVEYPTPSSIFGRLFGTGRKPKPGHKP